MQGTGEPSAILVRRAQAHDRDALAALYTRFADRIRRALRRLLGHTGPAALLESEDLLHDAILGSLHKLDTFEYRGEGSFLAWLLRIAEREARMKLRALRTHKRDRTREVPLDDAAEPPALEPSPSAAARGSETETLLHAALERLPEREREVIVLRRYLELDMEQIAEALNLPTAGAARALLSRAQARLATLLDEPPPA